MSDENDWYENDCEFLGYSTNHTELDANINSRSIISQGQDDQEMDVKNEKCAICLKTKTDPIVLSGCSHSFCFCCIRMWAQHLLLFRETNTDLSCPLCKQYFRTGVFMELMKETPRNSFPHSYYNVYDFTQAINTNSEVGSTKALRNLVYIGYSNIHIIPAVFSSSHQQIVSGVDVFYWDKDYDYESNSFGSNQSFIKDFNQLKDWISREIKVMFHEKRESTIAVILAIVQHSYEMYVKESNLHGRRRKVDLMLDLMKDEIKDFLPANYFAVFIRELFFFSVSILNMKAYDEVVKYVCICNKKMALAAECEFAFCTCKTIG